MHLPQNYFRYKSTFVFGLLLTVASHSLADEKEDLAAAGALIAMVESGKSDQAKQALLLFDSIPADSNVKPVAAHALALVHIQEHQNSEAWKAITSQYKEQDSAPDSIKFGKEKIKLWLRLEAGNAEKAELQFEQLLTMTLGADANGGEQTEGCRFIGGVVGMLKTDASSSCIPLPILEKAKEQLVTKVVAKIAKTKLEEQLAEVSSWGTELSALVSKFESVGAAKADGQNKLTQAEFEKTKREQSQLRDDLKAAGGGKQQLDVQRRKGIKDEKLAEGNLKREMLNQPVLPKEPGPQPRRPDKPQGRYKTDPKTQQRTREEPSASEQRQYEKELKSYNSWPARSQKYFNDKAQYPAKLQIWNQNVVAFKTQLKEASDAVASIEKAMKDMQEGIKQGVGKELKEAGDQAERLERFAAISNIAYKYVAAIKKEAKGPIRPSNFQLFDYEAECSRLRKSLR